MNESYWIISFVLAVLIGLGAALRITEHYLTKSNNVGDYTGQFSDFCRQFEVVGSQFQLSNRKKTPEIQRIENTLQKRREEVKKDKKVNGRIFN